MMFRKLYWVTEQFSDANQSKVTGVYTSIPDLIERGLRTVGSEGAKGFRISLAKLDCKDDVLGRWEIPGSETIGFDLQRFVDTGEMSTEEVDSLVAATSAFAVNS